MLDIMLMGNNNSAEESTPTTVGDAFNKFKTPLNEIKDGIVGITSVVGALCVAICLLGMLFSKNPKTVEEYKTWLKRIIVCWVCLLSLSVIVDIIDDLAFE